MYTRIRLYIFVVVSFSSVRESLNIALYTIQYRPIKNSNIKQVLGTSRRYSLLHSGVTWRGGQTAAGGGAGVLSDAAGGRGARQQVDAATSYINWLLQHGLTLSSLHAGQSLRCVKEPKSMKHNKKWTMPGNVLNRWYVIQSQGGGVCFLIDFIFSLADFFIFCIFSNWGNSTQSRLSTTSYGCGVYSLEKISKICIPKCKYSEMKTVEM